VNGKIPIVDWRFGDKYYVTEFITPRNVMVENIARLYKGRSEIESFINVARWIRDKFYYPLDWRGQPSCDGQFLKSRKRFGSYHFRKCVAYMWLFPPETINMGFGICIDTALLATSVLIAMGLDAWCVLGAIYDNKGELIGYHAWTEVLIDNTWYLLETTIHMEGVSNIMKRDDAYTGKYGIKYEKFAMFNDKTYHEYKSILQYMKFFGKGKREIRNMEMKKQRFIWQTYKEVTTLLIPV